jgi:hypothetical protein
MGGKTEISREQRAKRPSQASKKRRASKHEKERVVRRAYRRIVVEGSRYGWEEGREWESRGGSETVMCEGPTDARARKKKEERQQVSESKGKK